MNILSSVLKILDIPFTRDYLAKTFWTHPERGDLLILKDSLSKQTFSIYRCYYYVLGMDS